MFRILSDKKGVSTVFISMIIMSLVLVVAVLTEILTSFAAYTSFDRRTNFAAKSILAEYDVNLQNDYMLFGVITDEATAAVKIGEYIREPKAKSKGAYGGKDYQVVNLFDIDVKAVNVDFKGYSLLDINKVEQQANDAAVYLLIEDEIKNLKENLVPSMIGDLSMISDTIKIIEKANLIYKRLFEVNDAVEEIKKYADEKSGSELLQIRKSSPRRFIKEGEIALTSIRVTKYNIQKLESLVSEINGLISDFIRFTDGFPILGTAGNKVKEQILNLKNEIVKLTGSKLSSMKNTLNSNESILYSEIADAQAQLDAEDDDDWEISNQLLSYKVNMDFNFLTGDVIVSAAEKALAKSQKKNAESKANSDVKNAGGGVNTKNVIKSKELINRLPSTETQMTTSLLQSLLKGFNAQNDLTESSLLEAGKIKEMIVDFKDQLVFDEYALAVFSNHLRDDFNKETFFLNEIEYILYGNFDDDKNYEEFKTRFLLLRSAVNLIHIYSDGEKLREIMSIANAIAPGPASIAVQFAIASTWACAESCEDLKIIENGDRVPFMKSASSWNLSLTNLLSGKGGNSGQNKSGLSYKDYLRIFLITESREKKIIRAMDLIQINMKGRYYSDFLLNNCFTGINVTADATARRKLIGVDWREVKWHTSKAFAEY